MGRMGEKYNPLTDQGVTARQPLKESCSPGQNCPEKVPDSEFLQLHGTAVEILVRRQRPVQPVLALADRRMKFLDLP